MTGFTNGPHGPAEPEQAAHRNAAPAGSPSAAGTRSPKLTRQLWFEAKLAAARSDVLVLNTLCGTTDDPITAFRSIDRANLRRGVRYRMLFPDRARTAIGAAQQLHELAVMGAEVRTAPTVPTDALVVDGTIAVLPNDGGQDNVAVFHLPAVVRTIAGLFEQIWQPAMPLPVGHPPRYSVPEGRERELLSLLCLGCTDQSAAARLGISVRTVRRMVAGIMCRLDAHSRFQAGAKAADRGWIEQRAR